MAAVSVPFFAWRYLKAIQPMAEKAFTRGSPRAHTLADYLDAALSKAVDRPLPIWTEEATKVAGKREGWATWTNTKSGAKVKALYKNDMVQSLVYRIKCKHCGDTMSITNTYTRGVLTRTSKSPCYCYERDMLDSSCGWGCTCGRCLCRSVERQWGERSYW